MMFLSAAWKGHLPGRLTYAMRNYGRFTIEALFFKPTSGGFVFQAPKPSLLGRAQSYLVTEAQKAEIIAFMEPDWPDWRRAVLLGATPEQLAQLQPLIAPLRPTAERITIFDRTFPSILARLFGLPGMLGQILAFGALAFYQAVVVGKLTAAHGLTVLPVAALVATLVLVAFYARAVLLLLQPALFRAMVRMILVFAASAFSCAFVLGMHSEQHRSLVLIVGHLTVMLMLLGCALYLYSMLTSARRMNRLERGEA
jgi:hypothetical protein